VCLLLRLRFVVEQDVAKLHLDDVAFSYIPTGSSNDLARDLEYPKDKEQVINGILNQPMEFAMDVANLTTSQGDRAFAVSSGTDSRTILDGQGAEKLVGKGDMLYKPSGAPPLRVQGSFITAEECRNIADYIRKHYQANYDPNILEHLENDGQEDKAVAGREDEGDMDDGQVDELLHEVIQMAIEEGQTSTSMLQRRLRIGYARAGRLVDEMERRGIVSPQDGSKARKTLITREQYYEMFEDE